MRPPRRAARSGWWVRLRRSVRAAAAGAYLPERPGFLPWPHAAAAGLGVGIAGAGAGWSAWWLLLTPAALWRGPVGVVFVAGACLGAVEMSRWNARPNPFADRLGTEVTLAGRSDGRVLRTDDPAGAAVALAPIGGAPSGWVRIRGTLDEAAGLRNPGGFDYRGYLARRGIAAQLFVDEVLEARPTRSVRDRLVAAATRGLPEPEAALVAAMTFGVRDDLGELRASFAKAGLAHVLALSGLHVGVLVGALAWLLRSWGAHRYPWLLGCLAAFVAIVGPTPSILRASAMVAAALLVHWRGGGRMEPWTALSLAATLTLTVQPAWLFDASFQLSYLAVVGLLVFMRPLLRLLRADRTPWWHPRTLLAGGAAASVASQLPMGSLLMASFGEVPLLSPAANLLGVPLATAVVPLGLTAALAGSVWEPLAHLVHLALRPLAALLIRVAATAEAWPALAWGEVGVVEHATYGVLVVAVALWAHGRLTLRRAALVGIAAATVACQPPVLPEVVFMDVGQGDAVLVRLPGRREVLIDGGGTPFSDFDTGERIVLPALRALGVDELEVVVASHSDTDHIEGLASVLRGMPVQELVVGHPDPDAAVWRALEEAARETGVPIRRVRRGQRVSLGEAEFAVLHPETRPLGVANEDSVVLVFSWRGTPVALFPGDVSAQVEKRLAVPRVRLLMVPHHGSRHSTSVELLRAARPKRAVISVGRNRFGHPAEEVVSRLGRFSIDVATTRQAGAVRISVPDLLRP